jgi:hypothetical protein
MECFICIQYQIMTYYIQKLPISKNSNVQANAMETSRILFNLLIQDADPGIALNLNQVRCIYQTLTSVEAALALFQLLLARLVTA